MSSQQLVMTMILICMILINIAYGQQRSQHFNNDRQLTREIQIKQGLLQGVILEPFKYSDHLPKVERFLGIPYAAAPIGQLRFMPTGAPPRWKKNFVRLFDTLPPVCPQNLPSISKSSMSRGRFRYMQRLMPFLKKQNEDCLYLNIYAPAPAEYSNNEKYSVLVFIHGESFEWNSGNPYDGSVLASYGKVIVITFNFRLGILGFMKAGIAENTPSNFGLLDQIAALQWIQDNIEAFGGDPSSVTLMGHGTGAACVNYLMLSPVAGANGGLFHRAILMSGTALSDWALVTNPDLFTTQVAEQLNCSPPIDHYEEMVDCLRDKRLEDILNVKITGPRFMTRFGPVVDGSIVPNEPFKIMNEYKDLFKSYDLMFGLTEIESYHLLDAVSLGSGILEKDFQVTLRTYLTARSEYAPDVAYFKAMTEYTDIKNEAVRYNDADLRDILLDILSDARVAAPLIKTADLHLPENPKSYFYIFGHNSVFGEYSMLDKSVSGEELQFVFGIPKGGPKYHYEDNASKDEILLSEEVMRSWTNFAKTGNPNAPRRFDLNNNHRGMSYNPGLRFDLDWPEYELTNRSYMNFGIPPAIAYRYRERLIDFWNRRLPIEIKKAVDQKLHDIENKYPNNYHLSPHPTRLPYDVFRQRTTTSPNLLDRPFFVTLTTTEVTTTPETHNASITMHIVIILGICFLIINIAAFTLLYYKRDRLKIRERNLKENTDITPKPELPESSEGCNVLKLMKSSSKSEDTYEAVKNEESERFKLTRQYSSSTMDPNTKVRNWIAQEIVQKYSPKIMRRIIPPKILKPMKEDTISQSPTRPVSPNDSGTSSKTKPTKVSVAIDATPAARSGSILEQQPIEITKGIQPIRRSATVDDFLETQRKTGLDLQFSVNPTPETTVIKIEHSHSRSDPIDMTYLLPPKESLQTFQDINVTSRDDSLEPEINSTPLQQMQRRNYPKVLPDLPNHTGSLQKRRSLPPPGHLLQVISSSEQQLGKDTKQPPAPPPRTTSNRKDNVSTLHVGPILPKKVNEPKKPVHVMMNQTDPLYDNIQGVKHTPKTVITPTGSLPLRRAEPKVIIKPTLMRKPSDKVLGKHIPHVMASETKPSVVPPSDSTLPKSKLPKLQSVVSKKSDKSSDSSLSTTDSTNSDTGTVVKRVC